MKSNEHLAGEIFGLPLTLSCLDTGCTGHGIEYGDE
jgi:hypothetical protein